MLPARTQSKQLASVFTEGICVCTPGEMTPQVCSFLLCFHQPLSVDSLPSAFTDLDSTPSDSVRMCAVTADRAGGPGVGMDCQHWTL